MRHQQTSGRSCVFAQIPTPTIYFAVICSNNNTSMRGCPRAVSGVFKAVSLAVIMMSACIATVFLYCRPANGSLQHTSVSTKSQPTPDKSSPTTLRFPPAQNQSLRPVPAQNQSLRPAPTQHQSLQPAPTQHQSVRFTSTQNKSL